MLGTASAFATIVSLMGQFLSGRQTATKSDLDEFLTYLETHSHNEIKVLIEQSSTTSASLKALLNSNLEQLSSKLDTIENAITVFASRIEGFTAIAGDLNPKAMISEQCMSILKQMNDTGTATLLKEETPKGTKLMRIERGLLRCIDIQDPRFLEDDLNTLIAYRFFIHDYNSKGQDLYRITRTGASLAAQNT